MVADEIARLMGTRWTNQNGEERPLAPDDFMVVAPYNDQVKLLRARLDRDERTRDVPVGTVDKFQGRQAAVVFFTMTTSSGADVTRGADFLFSRNRLNVAVSRARCLAYLVCTEDLLNSRARERPGDAPDRHPRRLRRAVWCTSRAVGAASPQPRGRAGLHP